MKNNFMYSEWKYRNKLWYIWTGRIIFFVMGLWGGALFL